MRGVRFVVLALLAGVAGGALAQSPKSDFPNRPLRYIVPFPPGGSADLVARVVAAPLTDELGRQIVIDNRSGAAGTVGAEIAANATPDGYTIFACNIASLAVSPALYKKLNYDPVAGFAPVGLIGSTANALAVHPSVAAKTIPEFIALAKDRPGKINYSSAGVGTSPQLSMELFRMHAGIQLVHVPYKGAGPALVALLGGHVEAMFSTVPTYTGALRGGKVRLLAVTSTTRHPDLPDVPTLAESGMPGFEVISWQGLCTPAGVPSAVLARIRSGLEAALAQPEVNRQLADQGMQLTPLMAEKFAAFVRSERAKWAKVVKDVGIDPQ
jgi:tripartite-type tricarboxylate transporter receptor subunit TctC